MGVEDFAAERVDERLLENGAEAGHWHHVDVMFNERVDDSVGVLQPIEVLAEALPLDQHRRHTSPFGNLDRPTRSVDNDHDHGKLRLQYCLEKSSASRCEDPYP